MSIASVRAEVRLAMRWLSAIVIGICVVAVCPRSFAQDSVPTTIAGKPYSIVPGPKAGTYVVKWGDETMTWEAKPWMEDTLKAKGPAYYAQWSKAGMPFPWDVPVEKRDKLSPEDLMDRCIAYNYYGPYHQGGADVWNNLVIRPDGSLRETEHFLELWQTYINNTNQSFLTPPERPKVSRKYLWVAVDPEEVRGQSGVTTDFYEHEQRPQDTWYTPTVRKVRRLAGAVSKQFFPTTILRYEDVSHVRALPDLNYKIAGFELYKADPAIHGLAPSDYPNVKRADGGGEVAVILEVTPKPGVSWWYAKRRITCGLESLAYLYDEEYDEKGQKERTLARGLITGSEAKLPDGKPAPDWYVMWGTNWVADLKSGFKGDMWASNVEFDPKWPPTIFSDATLVREPRKIGFWGE
jgi:hypothetical protein